MCFYVDSFDICLFWNNIFYIINLNVIIRIDVIYVLFFLNDNEVLYVFYF